MSTKTINDNAQDLLFKTVGQQTSTASSGLSPSVSFLALTGSELNKLLGLSSPSTEDHDVSSTISLSMLDQQRKQLGEGQEEEDAFIEAVVSELLASPTNSKGATNLKAAAPSSKTTNAFTAAASSGTKSNPAVSGKSAIFEAAGLVSSVQSQAQQSIAQQMQNQIQMMEAELAAMQQMEAFFVNFIEDWQKYQDDPSYQNFEQVINDLESHYADDPSMEAVLQQIASSGLNAYDDEQQYDNRSGWSRFWHGQWSDPDYWNKFNSSVMPFLKNLEVQASGNPEMLNTVMKEGNAYFQQQIQQLLTKIQVLQIMVDIVAGGGSSNSMKALFDMEALLSLLQQLAINSQNSKQQDQTKISQATMSGLIASENKEEEQLKKLDNQSHGLFGWIKDLFDSIGDIFKEVFNVVKDVAEGNFSAAGKELSALTGISKIIEALKDIFSGDVGKGLELLLTAVVLTVLFGPAGMLLMNTSFGKDMENVAKLVVDAVKALVEVVGAGLLAEVGDDKDAKDLLDKAKQAGEAILQNPAFEAIAQLAMVVMIVASAVSGQFYLAALMTVLFVMSVSGAMSKMTDAIASGLEKLGLSKDAAQVVADVLVIVIIAIVSFGVGAVSAGAAAADTIGTTVEQESEEIEMVELKQTESEVPEKDPIEDESSNTVQKETQEQSKSLLDKLKDGFKAGYKTGLNTAGVATGFTLGNSTLGIDLAKLIDKNSEALQIIFEIIQMLMAILVGGVGGSGLASAETAGVNTQIGNAIGKVIPNFTEYLTNNSAALTQFATKLQAGAMAAGGLSQVAIGGDLMLQGKALQALDELKGSVSVFESAMNSNNQAIKETNSQLKNLMQQWEQIVSTFDAPSLAGQGVAQALIQG